MTGARRVISAPRYQTFLQERLSPCEFGVNQAAQKVVLMSLLVTFFGVALSRAEQTQLTGLASGTGRRGEHRPTNHPPFPIKQIPSSTEN